MRIRPYFLLGLFSFLLACRSSSPEAVTEYRDIYGIQKQAKASKAMVVTAHPLASRIGMEIIRKGGNAIDAAIAVQYALAVTYPVAGNIGGGGFMMIRMNDGRTAALDFREKAPLAAHRDMYLDSLGKVVPGLSINGHLAAGVPGTVDGLFKAFERFSQLKDHQQLIAPAIQLAKEGFAITPQEAERLNDFKSKFIANNTSKPIFVKDTPWMAGDLLRQKDLAQTLQQIHDQGEKGFYEGPVADQIVAEMKAGGGIISHQDLKEYEAQWRSPVEGQYKGYTIISMPPPSSGGIALLQLLKLVEPYPLSEWGFQSPRSVHLMCEAERRVYADRAQHLGDSDFHPVPQTALLNEAYLRQRMDNFDPKAATDSELILAGNFAPDSESEETTHFSIVDAQGNAVSVTTTINSGYGSKTVVSGAGFLLNNEMDDFSAKPGVPNFYGLVGNEANAIEPGKRMLSSMTPSIVLKDNELFMVVGTPGGSTIITSVFQVILNVVAFGMNINEAVNARRFHHQWRPDAIQYEKTTFKTEQLDALRELGHELKERGSIGRVDAILRQADGQLTGAADPRGDDHAEGW
ncbi:MAG: gamma-glutamyltransferase [Bacteroidota bacterium]